MSEKVDHPEHYGGKDSPHEAIKVIEAWGLHASFCLGNAVKYLARAGKKDGEDLLVDLRKARWYLDREIERRTLDRIASVPDDDSDLIKAVRERDEAQRNAKAWADERDAMRRQRDEARAQLASLRSMLSRRLRASADEIDGGER